MYGCFKSAEIEITTEQAVLTETQEDELCYIQSVFRRDRRVRPGEAYGNLLKAQCKTGGGTEINVKFTGSNPTDPATVFHLEQPKDDNEANTLRYRFGEDNYYLAVDTGHEKAGQVKLCKLDALPSEDKYFFKVKAVGREMKTFHTFQSLKTMEYLHCGDDGKVFMKEATTNAKGVPEDRQTWLRYHKIPEWSLFQHKEEYILHVVNENCIECETVTIMETVEDTEDSGKGNAREPEDGTTEDPDAGISKDQGKGARSDQGKEKYDDPEDMISKNLKNGSSEESGKANSEDPDEGNSKDLEKGARNDQGKGKSDDPDGKNSENLKSGNSEESVKAYSEDSVVMSSKYPGKGNSNGPGREKSEDPREVILEDLKEGNSGKSGKDNIEVAAKGNYPHSDAGKFD